jgi:8-oxo-dGTP pyrophosphatase MutT (NUDIX family)
MNETFEQFTQSLKQKLARGLPGAQAHRMMMPTTRDRKYVFPTFSSPPKESAVLLVFYEDGDGGIGFPLIQRRNYKGAHSGQVALPGGKAEESDPNLVYTALREAEEEIGVEADSVHVAGQLSNLHIAVSNYVVSPVLGFVKQKPTFIPELKEVSSVIESDLQEIINPERRKKGTITVQGNLEIETPYFNIQNKVVWGATAMILNELRLLIDGKETLN